MNQFKKYWPYVAIIALFAIIAIGYFSPSFLEGKVLFQGDTQQGIAIGQEAKQFKAQTGETTRWTNSLFGGMPNYQISPSYGSTAPLTFLQKLLSLFFPSPVGPVILMLIGFFIFMKCMRVRNDLAVLGSILWAFSSYFFILIEAGHLWKFITLAFIPPTIGGLVLTYQNERLKGAAIFALFFALQLLSNHVQMTYYFCFVMAALVIGYGVEALQKKTLPSFLKSTGMLLIAGILGVAANASNLYHTYEYSKETIRGKTELKANVSEAASEGGLEKDYITQWSYGIGETTTLLIPNTKGGATGPLSESPEALEKARAEYREIIGQQNHYWGDQPFTSGPVYVGAFVLFLAIWGFLILKGPMKWSLLAVTLLTVLLSWGRNFMPLTDLFIDYFPMYNKFRAVSSILVVAEFVIPLMAILLLIEWFKSPREVFAKKKEMGIAVGLTLGVAILLWITPTTFFSFLSKEEIELSKELVKQSPQYGELFADMALVRESIFRADVFRTIMILLIGFGILFASFKGWIKEKVTVWALATLCLIDLGGVAKRYLNNDSFVPKRVTSNPFPKSSLDEAVLQDPSYYRVFNLATRNPFNDAQTSYYHKSVGGYHAAKLRRYQEVIDHYLGATLDQCNPAVLNMLNTKYIFDLQDQKQAIIHQNPDALGAAWFVKEVKIVDNADQELEGLKTFDPRTTAIVDRRFESALTLPVTLSMDTTAHIELEKYQPNYLKYNYTSGNGGIVVFSEIYYPHGWIMTIDGKEHPIARANYILRAAAVPAGTHTIEMRFDPSSIKITEAIAYSALVLILGLFVFSLIQSRKKESQ